MATANDPLLDALVNDFGGNYVFALDLLEQYRQDRARVELLAVIKEPANIARYLAAVGETTEVPRRTPGREERRALRRRLLRPRREARGGPAPRLPLAAQALK